jgi:glycine/D-amino acid oxidase-like deaminating enzyme
MRVLICGGGAIGASIAYYVSRRGAEAFVVERRAVACAASGKSGGFLALDWCDGTRLESLARRSFALHAQLAAEIDGDWGYRRMTTYGGFAHATDAGEPSASQGPAWVSGATTLDRRLGTAETTAQVHPGLFTEAMMRAAEAAGARLVIDAVADIARDGDGWTVECESGASLSGDAVVVALGPWSVLAAQWLPLPAVFGLKGHSLVFATGSDIPADALFLDFQEASGALSTPEVFPRADGTTYVCAISSESPVPLDPASVNPDPGALERLEAMCRAISPALRDARIIARQACFRPVTQDGLPLIGKVPGHQGAYVATGHSVWGILNAPATGEALAELILDGAARTVPLSAFDPGRLPALDPAAIRTATA